MNHSLDGWDIGRSHERVWTSWGGSEGKARAKVLAVADGYYVTLVEAEAGYRGDAHQHAYPEFLYVIEGSLRTQGVELAQGDGYAAATGSTHTDFATDTGASYLLTFKI